MPRNYKIARDQILAAMPGTSAELVARTKYEYQTIRRWLKVLRADKAAYVSAWMPPNKTGNFVAVYSAGSLNDVECDLKPQNGADKWRIAKERYGADKLRQQERARFWTLKARRNGDPMVNALFGRA